MTQVNGNGFLLRQSLKKRRWLQGLTPPPCLEAGTLDPVRAATWVGSFNLGRAPVAQGWMCQSLHPSLEAGDAEEPGTVSAPGGSGESVCLARRLRPVVKVTTGRGERTRDGTFLKF